MTEMISSKQHGFCNILEIQDTFMGHNKSIKVHTQIRYKHFAIIIIPSDTSRDRSHKKEQEMCVSSGL